MFMKIIKLDAIDSTNSFLKKMAENSLVENYTVVVANCQTSGRGQMETEWVSEPGKNLTFSVFFKVESLLIMNQKYLNFAVALSVFDVLNEMDIPKLTIKWPNDIMAGGMKIGGILIENTLKGAEIQSSVVGIGLNVNESFSEQKEFTATSLIDIKEKNFDLDELLLSLVDKLKNNTEQLRLQKHEILEKRYLNVLHKKNVPSMFKTDQNVLFMGKIIGVSKEGKLQIELTDETVQEFGIKEVSFA